MRRQRFWVLLILGWIMSICLACDGSQTSALVETFPAATVSPAPSGAFETAALPPQTQSILDRAGSLVDPPRGEVRLVVISDLNSAYGSTEYDPEVDIGVNLIPFWQPDLVLCSGDMVAGQKSSLTPAQIRAMWAAFDQHVAAPLRTFGIPFGFTVGNHDASSAPAINGGFLFQQERSLAKEYWDAHDSGVQFVDRALFPFYYTFAAKDIFFLVWDGSSSQIPADKLAWVERALASPEAQQAKLRLVIGHLPLYGVAVGRDEPGEVLNHAEQLRALLEKYRVHTYISGHHHAYYPARKGQLQLLHAGLLGSGPRPLIDSDLPPRKTLTVVDVNFATPEQTTYTTYEMQTLQPILNDQLPRFLAGHNGMVRRRDVEALTAAEQSDCVQKIGSQLCRA